METNSCPPLHTVVDLLLDAICVVDMDGRYLYVSAAYERIFGYAPEEVLGRPMIELVHPDDRERTLQAAREIMGGRHQFNFQNRYIRKDGKVVHIMWSARWSETDRVRIAIAHDITEVKRAESMQSALLAISESAHTAKDLLALFQRIHQIIGELLPAKNFYVALYDGRRDELSFPYFVDEYDPVPAPRPLHAGTLTCEVVREGHPILLTPSTRNSLLRRSIRYVGRDSLDWLGVPLTTPNGCIGAIVVQSYSGDVRYTEEDQTLLQFVSNQVAVAIERKQNDTWLQYIAGHDVLTGLPNRELFHSHLEAALAAARRDPQRLSVLYIDLDRFKQANDSHGHDIGDLLLCEVAQRIRGCLRESDTVGRLGGDEFAVLLQGIHQPDDASIVAEKIHETLNRPFDLDGHQLQISSSIGIAVYPEHGEDRKQLMRHADAAMYAAKKHGRCALDGTDTPAFSKNGETLKA
ncbi:sensor domain-containing protein [Dyella nitratireducens]|uniref:Diguanylate cyclase n=1 Tax=Dyella nitratireducens TaxID=1849580 RepID=A0ABQ1FYB2_9GAMM|nr:GGDEF domain-containing protein [Dyella nitratireducens]GGA33815.1 diguanylate cyclase [Dyella nitratireducens]GLQ40780.1 diguanylate cyclase [Dyella nitratireducens]